VEPRSDRTWLMVGVGMGCLFVALLVTCAGTGAAFFLMGGERASAPPPTIVSPLPLPSIAPPSTGVAPPTLVPIDPPPSAIDDGTAIAVHATIATVTGSPGVSVGQTCEFNVERRDREDGSGFWCNAQIVCAGHLIYGGPTAGFFPCTLFYRPTRGVVGADPNTTAQDQDAAMSIDTAAGTLEVWDDAQGPNGEMHITAHIDSAQ